MGEWMLYGANGYTGELTARLAAERGMRPILAGRNAEGVARLARELGFEYRVFSLDNPAVVRENLVDVDLVLHHAGPFSATSKPMVDACLATGTHYLDITGEIAVFEAVARRDAEAKTAGIVLMPGVGFDVVPTDCMAALLARELPDANRLELAFAGLGGGPSQGTSKTIVEGLGLGGAVRQKGRIKVVPTAWKVRQVPFPSKTRNAVSIPWGDVSTAYQTTGIPNITVYMAMPPKTTPWLKRVDRFKSVLQSKQAQSALKKLVEWRVEGPTEEERQNGSSEVWGEVTNPDGERVSCTLRCPDGYTLTADSSLHAVERILAGEVEPGATTPAGGFGADYITTLEGVEVFDIISA